MSPSPPSLGFSLNSLVSRGCVARVSSFWWKMEGGSWKRRLPHGPRNLLATLSPRGQFLSEVLRGPCEKGYKESRWPSGSRCSPFMRPTIIKQVYAVIHDVTFCRTTYCKIRIRCAQEAQGMLLVTQEERVRAGAAFILCTASKSHEGTDLPSVTAHHMSSGLSLCLRVLYLYL